MNSGNKKKLLSSPREEKKKKGPILGDQQQLKGRGERQEQKQDRVVSQSSTNESFQKRAGCLLFSLCTLLEDLILTYSLNYHPHTCK